MAILDFIKNRGQAVSAPESNQGGPKPETAKQMHTREAEEAKRGPGLQDKMSEGQLAKAREAKSIGITGGEDVPVGNVTPAPSPSGGATNPQAMRQMTTQQDNAAPDLSPTSAQKGVTRSEIEPPAPTPPPSTPSPSRTPRSPSWER